MAFCEKREKYAQATIDLSDGTLTEFYPDGTKTFNIDDILKRWDGVPNMEPRGDFETVQATDGSKWYKQYAQDTVDRKPYQNAEGKVAYQEKLVKRVPDPPKRKDRL